MTGLTGMVSALVESKNTINKLLKANYGCNFKIGKTSQKLEDRFAQDYKDEYDNIHLVYISQDTHLIDWLEKELIKYYKEQYPILCDNNQIGGGPDEKDIALIGIIYVVIKN